jgi:hypothetical protein
MIEFEKSGTIFEEKEIYILAIIKESKEKKNI